MLHAALASLRSRLALLVLLPLVPALALILADAAEQRAQATAAAQSSALRLAQVAAAQHTRTIGGARRLLTTAAEIPALQGDDVGACTRQLQAFLAAAEGFTNFAVLAPDGSARCSAVPTPPGFNQAREGWFQQVLETGMFAVGDYSTGPLTGRPILPVAAPLHDRERRLSGLLAAAIDLSWFGTIPSTTALPANATVMVLGADGHTLLQSPPLSGRPAPAADALVRTVLRERSGTAELPGLDGITRLYGFAELAPNGAGAFLVIGVPLEVAHAAANAALARSLAAFALVIAMALAAAWLIGERLLLRHLRPLVAAAQRLSHGELAARTGLPHTGHGELSALALTFDQMAATLQQREAELGRRAAEGLELERRLQHTQRLESLGVLAGGIAHDFNNLLAIIRGNAGLAIEETAADHPLRQLLEPIDHAARRAGELTHQMMAYAGRARFVVEPVDLSRLVRDLGPLLLGALGQGAELRSDLTPGLPPVIADSAQMRQVVLNLVTNAAESMEERPGTIRVSTTPAVLGQHDLGRFVIAPDHPAERYICLSVADQGAGMDPETLARIFEPFFTTKFIGRGLGLAVVVGIIRGHDGALCVESEPGQGTTVCVLLPALPQGAAVG